MVYNLIYLEELQNLIDHPYVVGYIASYIKLSKLCSEGNRFSDSSQIIARSLRYLRHKKNISRTKCNKITTAQLQSKLTQL